MLVSARWEDGATVVVEITAERGGRIRLEDPFDGAPFLMDGIEPNAVMQMDGVIEFDCSAGQHVVLRRKGAEIVSLRLLEE